jgi:hypothetical protein
LYSRIVRLAFVLTSLAPIFLSLAFVSYWKSGISIQTIIMTCMALVLFFGCFLFAGYGATKLEVFSERVEAIKSADSEVLSFLFVYSFPFLTKTEFLPNYPTSIYIAIVFGAILYNLNCLYFSPTLSILGYHLYEINLKNGITCVLLTKRTFRGVPNELRIVRLSEYVLLEKE